MDSFFNEAQAVFGKRTQVRDAHDRYANQEVSYLMQRIENFDGPVIISEELERENESEFVHNFRSGLGFQERISRISCNIVGCPQ